MFKLGYNTKRTVGYQLGVHKESSQSWASRFDYFVDSVGGSDDNEGTYDLPWKTIAKVNSSTFQPGDKIGLKAGSEWRETLTVPSSGEVDNYITFGSYETGVKPKILGSKVETSWNQTGFGTAANNDLLEENFEGTGYEDTWIEAIGTNAGCLVDEDNADVARPTGGGSQVLKLVKVITPTGTAAASKAFTQRILANNKPIMYIDFYVLINAHGLASDGDKVAVFAGKADNYNTAFEVFLQQIGTDIRFNIAPRAISSFSFGTAKGAGSITLDQWYHFQILYDVTNHLYSVAIDGTNVQSGAVPEPYIGGIRRLYVGDDTNVKTATYYFDMVNVSSTNFYSPVEALPENVWRSDSTFTDPRSLSYYGNIFFKETDGDITWGKIYKATIAELAGEYDWTFRDNNIFIYSPTDPATRYSGVEVTQRATSISINDKEYISIDGLELAYGNRYGVGEKYPPTDLTGLKVQNCYIHHIGVKEAGYGILSTHSSTLIKGNEIHDSGRRNISINVGDAVGEYTQHDILIEDNELYSGYHTSGVDIICHASVTIDDVIIRRNLIYEDPELVIDGVETFPSEGMFIANQEGVAVTGVYIYNNIIKNTAQDGIKLEDVEEAYIYNNTFYGAIQADNNLTGFIYAFSGTNCVIKNNIFYNNMVNAVNDQFISIVISNTAGTVESDYNLFYCTDAAQRIVFWKDAGYTMAQWATYKSAKSQDANSPTPADPLFVSESDYHLQAGSPAINAGADVDVDTDYENNPTVGAKDIGAYEKQ